MDIILSHTMMFGAHDTTRPIEMMGTAAELCLCLAQRRGAERLLCCSILLQAVQLKSPSARFQDF